MYSLFIINNPENNVKMNKLKGYNKTILKVVNN